MMQSLNGLCTKIKTPKGSILVQLLLLLNTVFGHIIKRQLLTYWTK